MRDDPNKIIDYLFQTDDEFILEKIKNYKKFTNKSWTPVNRSQVSKLLKFTKQEFKNYYIKKLIQEKKNKIQKIREKIREKNIERQKQIDNEYEQEVYA